MADEERPHVQLSGKDGNVFSILARCREALRAVGQMDRWPTFQREATSGDYDHLLGTVMRYFAVD